MEIWRLKWSIFAIFSENSKNIKFVKIVKALGIKGSRGSSKYRSLKSSQNVWRSGGVFFEPITPPWKEIIERVFLIGTLCKPWRHSILNYFANDTWWRIPLELYDNLNDLSKYQHNHFKLFNLHNLSDRFK